MMFQLWFDLLQSTLFHLQMIDVVAQHFEHHPELPYSVQLLAVAVGGLLSVQPALEPEISPGTVIPAVLATQPLAVFQ